MSRASHDRVRIVLVEPLQPGNVGATVRAMANFGLTDLVVVDPPAFDVERARWMAPRCDDRIADIRFVATLEEALQGIHRAVATTARHRRHRQTVLEPGAFAEQVLDAPEGRVTALLFGREDFGLSREDTNRCDALVRIPTFEHASLNLAQAVLIMGWSLFEAARERGLDPGGRPIGEGGRTTADYQQGDRRDQPADLPTLEPAVDELVELLVRVGYTRGANPEKIGVTARGALQRGDLSIREVEALRGMVRKVQWALDNPDKDPRKPSSHG